MHLAVIYNLIVTGCSVRYIEKYKETVRLAYQCCTAISIGVYDRWRMAKNHNNHTPSDLVERQEQFSIGSHLDTALHSL